MNIHAAINHPMADDISIVIGEEGMCDFPHSVELAFFLDHEWVSDILPEFEEWAEDQAGDTRVYARVPLSVFASFFDTYSVKVDA